MRVAERVLCATQAEDLELAHETAKMWLNVALCQLRLKQNEACVESAARALVAAAPLLRAASASTTCTTPAGTHPSASASATETAADAPNGVPSPSAQAVAAANTHVVGVPDTELRSRARHIEAKANYLSARAATYSRDYERARDFIRKALELKPRDEDVIKAAFDLEKYVLEVYEYVRIPNPYVFIEHIQ